MKQYGDQGERIVFLEALAELEPEKWNELVGPDTPFLRYEFLNALESSGCVSSQQGWEPCHFVCVGADGALVAAAPQYIKGHSYGEYVFDWAWAEAYNRAGLDYYPKLITSVPFTPCVSPRLLIASAHQGDAKERARIAHAYQKQCIERCGSMNLSSWHVLFPNEGELLERLHRRDGVQYHWFNKTYQDFDAFLGVLVSRKRKNIRKERLAVAEQGLVFRWCEGRDCSESDLRAFYQLYQSTYLKRGQPGYLNERFFRQILQDMPDAMCFLFVESSQGIVAGALFFKGSKTLYGRYWGCVEAYHALHFEVCYYRGIEYCIANGFDRFDAGAQGEHKLLRGFEPVNTCSYHWLANPQFESVVVDFLERERVHVADYIAQAKQGLPYKKEMR